VICLSGCPVQPQQPKDAIDRVTQAMRDSCSGLVDGLQLADAQIAALLIVVEEFKEADASRLTTLSLTGTACEMRCNQDEIFGFLCTDDDDNLTCAQNLDICKSRCTVCYSAIIDYVYRE
jgi:hypothetical protein